jgi:hypothetical protein
MATQGVCVIRRDISQFGEGMKASELAKTDMVLEEQIDRHFVWHHYPPVPREMLPVAIDAIRRMNMGELDDIAPLPGRFVVTIDPRITPLVKDIINGLALYAWQCDCDPCKQGNPHWGSTGEFA